MQLKPSGVNCLDISSGCKGVNGNQNSVGTWGEAEERKVCAKQNGRDSEHSPLSTESVCKLGKTWGQVGLEPTGQPSMGLRIHSVQHDLETVKFHPRILRSFRLRDNGKGRSEVNS